MKYYSAKIDGVKMGAFPDEESAEKFEQAHSVPPWSAAFAEAVRQFNVRAMETQQDARSATDA